MLKLVGTENDEIVDEKVIIDDNNKPTNFAFKLIVIDLIFTACTCILLSSVAKLFKK